MHFTHSRTVELIAICTCLSGTQGKTNRKKFRRIVIPGGSSCGNCGWRPTSIRGSPLFKNTALLTFEQLGDVLISMIIFSLNERRNERRKVLLNISVWNCKLWLIGKELNFRRVQFQAPIFQLNITAVTLKLLKFHRASLSAFTYPKGNDFSSRDMSWGWNICAAAAKKWSISLTLDNEDECMWDSFKGLVDGFFS